VLEQVFVTDDGRIERYPYCFGVTGLAVVRVMVGWILQPASGITHLRIHDTGHSPEDILNAPEAAPGEHGHLAAGIAVNRPMLIAVIAHQCLHADAKFVDAGGTTQAAMFPVSRDQDKLRAEVTSNATLPAGEAGRVGDSADRQPPVQHSRLIPRAVHVALPLLVGASVEDRAAAASDVTVRQPNLSERDVMNRFSGHDRIGRRLARCVAGTLALFAMMGLAEPARAENIVTRWAEQSLEGVRAANVGTPNAGRLYAMVTVAMYDAINGIDAARNRLDREHALVPTVGAPRAGSRKAAAAAAAHAVLVALVPSQQAALDAALAAELDAAQDGDLVAGEMGS